MVKIAGLPRDYTLTTPETVALENQYLIADVDQYYATTPDNFLKMVRIAQCAS